MAGAPHNPDVWMRDRRPIKAAMMGGAERTFLAASGVEFERFERAGEMAMIPYLRVKVSGRVIEAQLRNFDWIEFGE